MKTTRRTHPKPWLLSLVLVGLISVSACDDDDDRVTNVDADAPTVVTTTPPDGAIDVSVDAEIVVVFSESIRPSSFDDASVEVVGGSTPIFAESTGVADNVATYVPDPQFERGARYTVTLSTAIVDTDGDALESPVTWSFTTEPIADTTPPEVISVVPDVGANDVALSTPITARFDEALAPGTVNAATFIVSDGESSVGPGAYAVNGENVRFDPDSILEPGTTYTVSLTPGITDLAGNPLDEAFEWEFTTAGTAAGPTD